MNTYEGELVLDPFMGSGTTAVAAVRTGRHFIGYETDAAYVRAAEQRIATETLRPQVRLLAASSANGDPLDSGWAAKDLATALLGAAGFTAIAQGPQIVPGVEVTLAACDCSGRRWWFEVVGGRTSNRPGAQRVELLWRAIAKAAVAHGVDPTVRFGVLTTGLPTSANGGRALDAVTGPDRAVAAVIDLLADDVVERLRTC